MLAGLGVLAAAATVSLGGAIGAVSQDPAATLRLAAMEAGFEDSVCPDGWAADHAATSSMSEAQITSWYLGEAFARSDSEVLVAVGTYLAAPRDPAQAEGEARIRNQINLCIAESRRLIPYPLKLASLPAA